MVTECLSVSRKKISESKEIGIPSADEFLCWELIQRPFAFS